VRARIFIAGVSVALGCASCGFKGPLYLPGRSSAVVTHPAPPARSPPGGSPAPAKAKRKNGQPGAAQAGTGPG